MIEIEDVLEVMGSEAKKVCENVFPLNRPNATDSKLSEFIVVSLPYSVMNKTLGESDDWWLDETVVFEIYVADKKGAHNPKEAHNKRMRALRSSLRALFPIVDYGVGIKIPRPRTIIPSASDGDGYHYSRIQARMTTMV